MNILYVTPGLVVHTFAHGLTIQISENLSRHYISINCPINGLQFSVLLLAKCLYAYLKPWGIKAFGCEKFTDVFNKIHPFFIANVKNEDMQDYLEGWKERPFNIIFSNSLGYLESEDRLQAVLAAAKRVSTGYQQRFYILF